MRGDASKSRIRETCTSGSVGGPVGRPTGLSREPLGVGFLHVHPPYCYRCPFDQTYPTCGRTCVGLIEKTIQMEDPETVAAVIVEPISISSAGFMVPPPDYLRLLREVCTRHNVVLIYDEIITGFGRLGEMFASEYYHAAPDITCCGKGMSGGYAPLSAILIRDRIADAFYGEAGEQRQFHHGHTYGGNPVACAAGVAALTQLIERDLIGNARRQGAHLRERLEGLAARYSIIGDVRGAGMLQGVEFVADRRTKARFGPEVRPGKVVERACRERGLLLRCGDEFAAFAPPLVSTVRDIDEMCDILGESIGVAEAVLA